MKRKLYLYFLYWRKYGVFFILISVILEAFFCNCIVLGLTMALMLTVPCGISYINNYKWLWYLRQLYFAIVSLGIILK